MNTNLIIVAHPDDEVLGCGGTIARLGKEGYKVYICILGEGIISRYHKRSKAVIKSIKDLNQQSHQVGQYLQAKEVFLFDLPDNRFDTVPLLDIVKVIENLLNDLQPQIIYTHHGGDLNVDHQIVNRAVLTATRPLVNCPVKELYTFEVPSSTEWSFQQLNPLFSPNVFINITDTLEAKIQAMQLYKSELRPLPHPRSPESLRAIAHRWGNIIGLEAAEAFQLIRSIK